MSGRSDEDITALLTDLVSTLRELETEVEPTTESGLPRPPTPEELLRFTSDVTIPAAILILKTNIQALKLLRRALRMAEGRPTSTGSASTEVRDRATKLSKATLSRLDEALTDIQRAVEGQPEDEDARELLEEARKLRSDLEDRLDEEAPETNGAVPTDEESEDVAVDVEAELRSIKDDLDDLDDPGRDRSNDGNDDGAAEDSS
jgi:hypothetical protein